MRLLFEDDWFDMYLIADYWLLITDYWWLIIDCWLLIVDYSRIVYYFCAHQATQVSDYWLLMVDEWLFAHYQLFSGVHQAKASFWLMIIVFATNTSDPYKSNADGRVRKSLRHIVVMPWSSWWTSWSSATMTTFLKESSTFERDRHSCFLFSSVSIL